MILFKDIYQKAINLFDDPDINRAYVFDRIRWQKMMYNYFQNAITLFRSPLPIALELSDRVEPTGQMEIFKGNGGSVYELSSAPIDGSDFSFKIAGEKDEATYDKETNSVIFSKNVDSGTECSVEWYFGGVFKTDFKAVETSAVSSGAIMLNVEDILTRALVLTWAEKEKNNLLEVKNVLTDTDFNMYSPANSVKAKVEWVKQLQFELDSLQNKLGWTMFAQARGGGKRYGP